MSALLRFFLAAGLISVALLNAPQEVREDFATYSEGRLPKDRWEVSGLGWSVRAGRLVGEPGTRSNAIATRVPYASEVVVEAVLRPTRSVGDQWKTAGIAIILDDENFWHLALVEAPRAQGERHYLEMHEMLEGRWLADSEGDTALPTRFEEGGDMGWTYGQDYRLRLELADDRISGVIEEVSTGRAYRVERTLAGRFVRSGRPALFTSGLGTEAAYLHATVHRAGPGPAVRKPPAYDLKPMSSVRRKATGFFRVEKIGDRWWVVDPRGYAFYVVGTDHVNYHAHWCEKLGYAPYSRNVQAKYGSEEAWARSAAERLKKWGFNTLGAGHSPSVRYRGLAHTVFLSLGTAFTAYGDIAPRTTWTGFPDVFDPRFAEFCEIEARKQCAPHRDDPWLLGYFLDNELEWFGKSGSETGLVEETMKKSPDHPAKRAFVSMLRERYGDIGHLNAAWGTSFASWEALAGATELPATAVKKDLLDFVRLIAERYFSITSNAIRKADPNHMVIGCRFAGFAPPIWDIAGRYCDIVTVNYYGTVDLERRRTTDMPEAMARYHRQSGRPLLITEWSFPALDAGLPCRHGAGQRVPTQKDKALAYRVYQTALFAMPFMVGSNYFMWVDEPELGISSTFPEDSNYGLVDVEDRPWPELTATAASLNPRAVAIHAGDTAELSAQIAETHVVVRNTGRRPAAFLAEVWVQGVRQANRLRLGPGGSQRLPLRIAGPTLVAVVLDPSGEVTESRLDDNLAWRLVGMAGAPRDAVVVANPSEETLLDVPVVLKAPAGSRPMAVVQPGGRPLASQWDSLPGGPELCFLVAKLPARSALVCRLRPDGARASTQTVREDNTFRLQGALRLEADAGDRSLIERIALGELPIGRLTALVHQTNGQPLWVEPRAVERVRAWIGPVRTVRLVECVGGGGEAPVITEVDREGSYAPRRSEPGRFRLTARLDLYPKEPWLGVQILEIANVDTRPWNLESYFIYPLSRIGGSASNDAPGGTGDAPRWHDPQADVSYGVVMDTRLFRGYFWKDTPDGEGQHADVYRTVRRRLGPGEVFRPSPPDPPCRAFVTRGDSVHPANPLTSRLRALQKTVVKPPARW